MVAYSNPSERTQSLKKARFEAIRLTQPDLDKSPGDSSHRVYQRQRRLTAIKADALAEQYLAGASMRDLAKSFGIHRSTVTALLIRHGVQLRQPGIDAEQLAEACRLYPDGWSLARLADRYGVDDMTVRAAILRAGVPMRPRQGGRRRA